MQAVQSTVQQSAVQWIPSEALNYKWMRKASDIHITNAYSGAKMFTAVGVKGAGKSAMLEAVGSNYTKIVDIYGSRDNEGLAWLRSPFKDSVLLLKGQTMEVKAPCDVMNMRDVTLQDLAKYRCIISCASFYSNVDEEHQNLGSFMQHTLWKRTHWHEPWFVIIREAGNLLYARMKIGESQVMTKAKMIYVFRESRHCGLALGVDALRTFAVDIDIRQLSDYTFFKAMGVKGMPRDLEFIYRYFEPSYIRDMPVQNFVVLSLRGAIGAGQSLCPPWHKKETEDLLAMFHIEATTTGELPFRDDSLHRVDDYEHVRIIKARLEGSDSMEQLAKNLHRSSGTIWKHIHAHNNLVHSSSECDRCRLVGSPHSTTVLD